MSIFRHPSEPGRAVALYAAAAVTKRFANDITIACPRIAAMQSAAPVAHVARLIAAGALTDAALAMIALETPQWQLARIAYDDGEWYCTLSSRRELPDWIASSVLAHDSSLPVALLNALQEARSTDLPDSAPPPAARTPDAGYTPVCCDNFA